jgi:hypothetical protein
MNDFTLYYLFRMQRNALLIRQNFIVAKSGCYNSVPLRLQQIMVLECLVRRAKVLHRATMTLRMITLGKILSSTNRARF